MSRAPAAVATQAVVLCGGKGTRLGPTARTTPKALHEVGGRPFLDRLLETLGTCGVPRVHLCLGHLAAAIQEHVVINPPPDMNVSMSVEEAPEGTAGALRHAENENALDEVFLLLMGDTYLDIDLAAIASALPTWAETMMVVTSYNGEVEPNVEVTDGRVSRYDKVGVPGGWTDTGVSVVRRRVVESLPNDGVPVDLLALFSMLAARGKLAAHCTELPFYDIGTPTRLQRFARFMERTQ